MKATGPEDGLKAMVHGTVLSGAVLGLAKDGINLTVGYEKRQVVEIIDSETTLSLEWPTGDLLNLIIGSEFPINSAISKINSMGGESADHK